ncbi:MAG TPA: protein kinase [Kofleriaceae bacterium]
MAPQLRDHERYDILGEHGRGGLGRVSRAHDRELGRDIAIKELIARGHLSEVRFLREALITARLEHPGIVPVYEAGRWPDGTPFYAMKLVSGRPLRDLIAERKTVDERLGLLHHVIAVADAIAYAHGRSIIHRDLKPANVIVGEFGETVVIDWGLAKDLTAAEEAPIGGGPFRDRRDDGLTSAGAVLGTPAYMAPEQARGEPVDQRADVFAIGAMLWELCSLHKLPAGSSGQRRRALRRAGIDHDLIAIIEKALAPDREQRYPEAGALAADLKAFKSGARIAARSYSLFGMLAHWTRRHRALAGSVAAAVVVAIGASLFYVRSVATERDRADAALARVEATNDKLARERAAAIGQRNELILSQATAALESDPTRAIEWLETYPPDGAHWDRVQVIAADAQSRGVARHILPSTSWTISISPDGKTVMTAGMHDLVQVWDLATGRRLHGLSLGGEVAAAAFAPDGHAIAIGGQGGEVVLWSPISDARTRLGKLDSGALSVAFSPDGQLVIAASLHAVAAWDVTALRQVWSMPSAQAVTFLAVAPSGRTLAFGTADGTLHVSDFDPGHTRQLHGHRGPISWIAFSAEGRSIATGSVDHSVRWWDPVTGAGHLLGMHDGQVTEVRFSPVDPTLVASGGTDQKLRLWSTVGGGARVFSGHTDKVLGVMFAPDGQTVASVSSDRQVRLWDVASGDSRVLSGHLGDVGDVRFSPDGSLLVSSGFDPGTRVWRLTPPPGRTLGRHEYEALQAVFSPTGRFVASTGADRTARLWDLASGRERSLPGSGYTAHALPTGVMFSTRGELLASVGDSAAHLWNLSTGEARVFVAPDALLRRVAITGDGRLLAAGDVEGGIRVWEVASNRLTTLAGHTDEVTELAFLPRGDRLVSAAMDGTIRIWDVSSSATTGQVIGTHRSAITRLAVSPAGNLVASGGRDGTVHLWNLTTHADRALAGHTGSIAGLVFSRDGRRLASASLDATVRIWNVDTGEARVLRGHDEEVRTVAFAPDGHVVASGGNDRTVRLWNLETGAIAIVRGHHAIVTSVAFDADGEQLVTTSEDATVRLWDLDRITWAPRDRGELTAWLQAQTTAALPPPRIDESSSH